MSSDFTVVFSKKHGFGNEPGHLGSFESNVIFAGPTRIFTFDCPGVNPDETAVLMFQSRDVDFSKNVIRVNPSTGTPNDVAGGIPVSPEEKTWNGNVMLIDKRVLRASGNELHIESRNKNGNGGGDIDDFILDNVVVMYKTRTRPNVVRSAEPTA